MERYPSYEHPAPRANLTPDQVEAIARQLPGRYTPDLMRLQQPHGEEEHPVQG